MFPFYQGSISLPVNAEGSLTQSMAMLLFVIKSGKVLSNSRGILLQFDQDPLILCYSVMEHFPQRSGSLARGEGSLVLFPSHMDTVDLSTGYPLGNALLIRRKTNIHRFTGKGVVCP